MRKKPRSIAMLLGDDPAPRRPVGRQVEDHRQKLVLAQADLAELRAQKLRGDLVPAADVAATWAGMIADARQRLLAIPSRLGAQLALPRPTVAAIDAEIRAVLSALAGQGRADDAGEP